MSTAGDRVIYGVCFVSILGSLAFRFSKDEVVSTVPPKATRAEEVATRSFTETETIVVREPSSVVPADLKPIIVADEWQIREAEASRYFSTSPIGRSLATLAALAALENEPSQHQQALQDAIADVEQHPDDAISELAVSLPKLPEEFADSRLFLMQFSTKLRADSDAKVSLIRSELARLREPASVAKAKTFDPTISFETLMDVTDDPRVLGEELKALSSAFGTSPAGRTLRERYLARFPPRTDP